jgi:hypothetical protein
VCTIDRMRGAAKKVLRGPYHAARDLVKLARSPFNRFRQRRLDLCCCGVSKTGTHSMAGLFEAYRSAHHPDTGVRLPLASAYLQGEVDHATARNILRRRDRRLWLEMESSTLAGILIEPLSEACPGKKFVLTVRDVFSWCDSWLDHAINWPLDDSDPFAALDRIRLRAKDFQPTKFDKPLTARGFLPLACYFQLWTSHNARVLDALPKSRLLMVETQQISTTIPEIATWAGVPSESLRRDRDRLFTAPKKHRVLATLDNSYVQDTADRFCGDLMNRLFSQVAWHPT